MIKLCKKKFFFFCLKMINGFGNKKTSTSTYDLFTDNIKICLNSNQSFNPTTEAEP